MKRLNSDQVHCVSGGHWVDSMLPDGVTYDQIAPYMGDGEIDWGDVLDEDLEETIEVTTITWDWSDNSDFY